MIAAVYPRLRRIALGLGLALGVVVAPEPAAARARTARAPAAAPKLTRPPELVGFVEAEYPEAERAAGRTATVGLRIALDASGHVTKVEVASSAGEAFDRAAVRAAEQFTFTPAEIDGKPGPIAIEYSYAFTLAVETPPPAVTAGFVGIVLARGTKTPVVGARVVLRVAGEAAPREAITDAEGRFTFEGVPPGEHEVALSGAELTAVQTRETLTAGEELDVRYEVALAEPEVAPEDGDDLEILVVAPPLSREASSTKVRAEDARKGPAPRATWCAWSRACPASRARPRARGSSWCGAPRRPTRGCTSTACRSRDSTTKVACARWCTRSSSTRSSSCPAGKGRCGAAASAAWSR